MTRYYLKIKSIPTESNYIKGERIEYWGKRETYLSSLTTPSIAQLLLFGFGSFDAAKRASKQKEEIYKRDFDKFHSYYHEIEIMSEDI